MGESNERNYYRMFDFVSFLHFFEEWKKSEPINQYYKLYIDAYTQVIIPTTDLYFEKK